MFRLFYPYEYVESVFNIDYRKLHNLGFRGLIFDIDNTLVHHGDPATKDVEALFSELNAIGFKTLLLTNNDESRTKLFNQNINSLYISEAHKPKRIGYLKALKLLNIKREEAIFIGDQVFTDILGANRCGIANILVKFIRLKGETKIGKRRHLENMVLKRYTKAKKYRHRLGDITK